MSVSTSNQEQFEPIQVAKEFLASVQNAVKATQSYLLRDQHEDGHWRAELEGDTILESEYILTMHFIGRLHEQRVLKAANYLREKALPTGGWAIYPDGPADVSASAKAYFVLKLLGDNPNARHMAKAREVIQKLGGLHATNSFTRLYLAIFGQYPWEMCPAVPPEVVLLPKWCPVNLYDMSSWSRGIVVPLTVIWACKPHCPVPEHANIDELLVQYRTTPPPVAGGWPTVFSVIDVVLKAIEKTSFRPLRKKALLECERWMIEHFKTSDGIGAIFPPIINTIIALRCLGYDNDHPLTHSQVLELQKLEIEEGDTLRVEPCFSPVWDTAYAMHALLESGISPSHPAILKGADWLLDKECRVEGDWKVKNPNAKPGGWYFEYANDLYPDMDDTFEVLTVLNQVKYPDAVAEEEKAAAVRRGLDWAIAMQNDDGGWGAFDRGCDKEFLTKIPFADHNAMIDPSTSDITSRGVESLITCGYDRSQPTVQRALQFLHKTQEHDGTWFGRWGVNYIYGTWLAIHGLRIAGEDMKQISIQRAAKWLRAIQNPDGGWGESPASYDDPALKGKGASTAAQTAWSLMALMDCGDFDSPNVLRGIEYLTETQGDNGCWQDDHWTGTGFPRVFYLNYHYYSVYFPLMALSVYRKHRG